MSQFIREFEKILEEEGQSRAGSRIFEIAGLDKSMLSRVRAGAQIQFSEIPRIASAIGAGEMIFLRLLRARLLEELSDERAARNITIDICGRTEHKLQERPADYLVSLHPDLEKAMRQIAKNIPKDAGLRATVRWLGNDLFAEKGENPAALEPAPPFAEERPTDYRKNRRPGANSRPADGARALIRKNDKQVSRRLDQPRPASSGKPSGASKKDVAP